ncbi:MAG TPA: type II secretion system minor pseudopilin GspK [Candidatus Limnocylindrales bacterium]|nr:type II secretion system minor pseudopilin GspK [Candidatus Limnocylindrales bacterium]
MKRKNAGVALLITLLVLVLIVILAMEIFRAGARAAQTGAFGRDSVRGSLLAEAGLAAARIALRETAKDFKYDTLDQIWSRPVPPIELGEGTILVTVEDEDRKINLNRLVLPNGNAPDEQRLAVFRKLLANLDIDPSIADAVVDWLDNDDTPRVGGAESSYYLSLPYPYRAKNDLFDTLDELRLVRGMTPERFDKIKPFATIYSSGKVNINTAPKEVLMALSAGQDAADAGEIDDSVADQIVEYRKDNPFRGARDIGNVSPSLRDLYTRTRFPDLLDVKGTAFRVRSTGNISGISRTIDAVGLRSGNDIQWRYWRLE